MLLTRNVRNETRPQRHLDHANAALTNMTAATRRNVTSEGMRKDVIQLGNALNDPITMHDRAAPPGRTTAADRAG